MTYPDGEVVTYHYNAAGQVESLTSNKQGRQSVIVDRIGYDKEGHTVYTKLGNGTETTYTYDKQRERLQVMNLTADGQTVMENRYRYDAVDNILGITNAANPTSLTKLNKAKLGGRSSHTYEYGLPSNARVIDKYSLLSNNCTTKSVTAVQIGGTKLDFIEDRGTVPTPVYVPNPTQMKSKIYAPSDMSNYLNVLSKRPYSVVKNITLQMNREINKLLK